MAVVINNSFDKHVGIMTIIPLVLNPNAKMKKEVLGFEPKEGSEDKPYNGVSKTGLRYSRIQFYYNIKELDNPKIKESVSILFSEAQDNFGQAKLGFIDNKGTIAYGTDKYDAKKDSATRSSNNQAQYGKSFPVLDDKSARPLYKGEKTLMTIYKAITGNVIVFDAQDIEIILNGGDEAMELLNSYFIVKKGDSNKGFMATVGMDTKGNLVLYEEQFYAATGKVVNMETKLTKRPFEMYDSEVGGRVAVYYTTTISTANKDIIAAQVDSITGDEEVMEEDIDIDAF